MLYIYRINYKKRWFFWGVTNKALIQIYTLLTNRNWIKKARYSLRFLVEKGLKLDFLVHGCWSYKILEWHY